MEKVFYLKHGDRLQINHSSGCDIDVTRSLIDIQPILIRVGRVQTDESIEIICHFPTGVNINHLKRYQSKQPYWSDSHSTFYGRLTLDRPQGTGILISESAEKCAIEEVNTKPIIVEPMLNSHKRCKVFIAATLSWDIAKEELLTSKVASDPTSVPSELKRLCHILEEPVVDDIAQLKNLQVRLRGIKKAVNWFNGKFASESVKEWGILTLARLDDLSSDVAFRIHEKENVVPASVQQSKRLRMSLSNFLSDDEVSRVLATIASINKEPTDEQLDRDPETFELIKSALDTFNDELPLHRCKYGHEAKVVSKNIASTSAIKKLYFVTCTQCENQLLRHDWGERTQSIAVWNKNNPQDYRLVFPKSWDLSKFSEQEIHKKLKSLNTMISYVMQESAKGGYLPISVTEKGRENLTRMTCWTRYIKDALKHSKSTNAI